MKTLLLVLLTALTGLELTAQTLPNRPGSPNGGPNARLRQPIYPNMPGANRPGYQPAMPGMPSADAESDETIPPGLIDFQGVDITQVLEVYAKLVNRTIIRGPLPDAKIVLKTQTPLTKKEAIEAIQAVLALNNVSVVNMGDKFVKAAQSDQAGGLGAPLDYSGSTNLPDLGTYVTHITQLRYVKPSVMVPLITPFARLPNSVFAIDDNGILVIRDYAENVKRMLEMIAQIDVSVPAEYISEVIPIRYAKVDDIANALNSLGGSGSSTVSVGSAPANSQISGFGNRGSSISGLSGGGGIGGSSSASPYGSQTGLGSSGSSAFGSRMGTTTPNGTPAGGSTFAQRLNNIINRASGPSGGGGGGQEQIQLFGQTKIIPDESSSSLLIYATRQDMATIKDIIAKLDVPLAQVLVEAIIMDVNIGKKFSFGVSAQQNPKAFTGGNLTNAVIGGGGMPNGPGIINFVNSALSTAATNSSGSLSSTSLTDQAAGFNYFGNIGPTFDLAVQAAENDTRANVIQQPRIQTSQAKPAQFFVGNTVPYVTGTYNYGGAYGSQSSYSQLSVGVELDVTPFINPDGEVSMDIQQEIDDLNGFTTISGVGEVPNTIKRTLNTSITVRNRDTVMLGGFIRSDKSTSRLGVPFLQDIPLLGNLFTSRNDSKDREELIVLMRPTVLKTPKMAAENTIKEAQRLPGVSGAAADDTAYERSLEKAERLKEEKSRRLGQPADGFYNMEMPADETNAPAANAPSTQEDEPTPDNQSNTNPAPAVERTVTNTPVATPAAEAAPAPAAAPAPDTMSDQERARAEFMQKSMNSEPSGPAITPAQQKKLDDLRAQWEAKKITTDQYISLHDKILSGSQ